MTSVPNEGIKVECMECPDPSVSLAEWNWKTSDRLVSNLLSKASYSNIDSEEVKDMVRAMGNSLSGPKGFIMKGQGRSIDVLRDDIQYGYKVEKEKPYKAWIKSKELPSCHAG